MKKRENSKLAMYIVTAGLETVTRSAVITKMPQFDSHLTGLNQCIAEIQQLAALQRSHERIGTVDKSIARETLESSMLHVGFGIRAYAIAAGMEHLAESFRLTGSGLARLRDQELSSEAKSIIQIAIEKESQLIPFGIVKNDIESLTAATTAFTDLITVPRTNRVIKSDIVIRLTEAFAKADKILRLMDVLADTMRRDEPDFYNDYWNRRRIISLPSNTIAVKGMVTDVAGNLLKKVTVTVDGLPYTATTTAKGTFRFSSLPDGVHNLRFSRPGYHDVLHAAPITRGIRYEPSIEMHED